MFTDYWKYDWVPPLHVYDGIDGLLRTLGQRLAPAEP
jgi:hypothetical protein